MGSGSGPEMPQCDLQSRSRRRTPPSRVHAADRLANASSRNENGTDQAPATQIGRRIDVQVVNGRRRWQRSCVPQQPITAQVQKRDEVARSAAVAQLAA